MSSHCFHGGAFWEARLRSDAVQMRSNSVNADVLDAWFPPAPEVIEAVQLLNSRALSVSPPTYAEPLTEKISTHRGIPPSWILPGPGSSALIYLVLRHLLGTNSSVVLIEPSYGEYAHVCENLIGCKVHKVVCSPAEAFKVNLDDLVARAIGADLVVLVNPNNPTGESLCVNEIRRLLGLSSKLLIDEAYLEFSGLNSAESLLSEFQNLMILKSLSKVFALSGMRVGYLAGQAVGLFLNWVPPWWTSLPAQAAAIAAFDCSDYYQEKYKETKELRLELANHLGQLGMCCYGLANWVLAELPSEWSADELVARLRREHIYIRDAGASAPSLGPS